jgi:lysine decarboxylase
MADRDTIVAVVTVADDAESLRRLTDELSDSIERRRGTPRRPPTAAGWILAPTVMVPPRDAFFGSSETVTTADAVGRISAELIAPYPPGVPVLAPGELVTREAISVLTGAQADGVRIAYAGDPRLRTLEVLQHAP